MERQSNKENEDNLLLLDEIKLSEPLSNEIKEEKPNSEIKEGTTSTEIIKGIGDGRSRNILVKEEIKKREEEINNELLGGMRRPEVMKKYGVSYSVIKRIRAKYGQKLPKKRDMESIENNISDSLKEEIVRYAEGYGRNAAQKKYSISGPQFLIYYKMFGRKMKKGRRIVTDEDIQEMGKYAEEHGLAAVLDRYCISKLRLFDYYKNLGYRFYNRKWIKVDDDDDNTHE